MHKLENIDGQTIFEFPENATEFTPQQLKDFVLLLTQYQADEIDWHSFKVSVVYKFLNLVQVANLEDEDNAIIIENIHKIAQLVDDFFTTEDATKTNQRQIKMDFFVQNLPKIKIGERVFYGPQTALFNTVYGEYLKLTTHLSQFAETQDPNELDLLIATIYRPKKEDYNTIKNSPDFDGDIRQAFNANLTPIFAETIKALPYHLKYAIFLYVASSQHFIANNDALDIGGGVTVDLTVLFSSSPSQNTTPGIGMIGTLYSLAETNVFGNVTDVVKQNTYDILVYLVKQTLEYNQLKHNNNAAT